MRVRLQQNTEGMRSKLRLRMEWERERTRERSPTLLLWYCNDEWLEEKMIWYVGRAEVERWVYSWTEMKDDDGGLSHTPHSRENNCTATLNSIQCWWFDLIHYRTYSIHSVFHSDSYMKLDLRHGWSGKCISACEKCPKHYIFLNW